MRRRGVTRWASDHWRSDLVKAGDDEDSVSGLAPGASADLVVVAADTVTAAVMDHPPRTLVIRGGDVIARDGELC